MTMEEEGKRRRAREEVEEESRRSAAVVGPVREKGEREVPLFDGICSPVSDGGDP